MPDALQENRLEEFVPCGAVCGVIARTDVERGVWKAPAGLDATLAGVRELTYKLTDGEQGDQERACGKDRRDGKGAPDPLRQDVVRLHPRGGVCQGVPGRVPAGRPRHVLRG